MSIIGFHFAGNVYSESQRARWLNHLIDIKPRFVVILVAGQRQEAMQFCIQVMTRCPYTRVIIRHYADGGDEGRWREFNPDGQRRANYIEPRDYIARIGALYKIAFGPLTNWYLMPDNEFSSDDRTEVEKWLRWQTAIAKHAREAGIKLAMGCQPTHHPDPVHVEAKWYDPLWMMFKTYPEHLYYRNVYYAAGNLDGLRYLRGTVERMNAVADYIPQIVIGELARLRSVKEAQHGYKSIASVTRTALATEAVSLYRTYLQGLSPKGVYVCWYCVGEWPIGHDTFNIADDSAFFDVLRDVAHEKLPDTSPLPGAKPPADTKPLPMDPPLDDEDTVIIDKPDDRESLVKQLEELQLMTDFLRIERDVNDKTIELCKIKNDIINLRNQKLQAEMLLIEAKLDTLEEMPKAG